MPVVRTYQCPNEQQPHVFDFLHMNREEPPPDYCPKCGTFLGDELQSIPTTFAIPTAKGQQTDKTYREIEAKSLERAQRAMELGATQAEANQIKVTNLRDNLREGDVAGIPTPVNNIVTQVAQEMAGITKAPHPYFRGGGASAASLDANNPSPGKRALSMIQGKNFTAPTTAPSGAVQGRWGNG